MSESNTHELPKVEELRLLVVLLPLVLVLGELVVDPLTIED